eukprot:scaffold66286_cov43-Prasinocladus_malaysianus.AAC.1
MSTRTRIEPRPCVHEGSYEFRLAIVFVLIQVLVRDAEAKACRLGVVAMVSEPLKKQETLRTRTLLSSSNVMEQSYSPSVADADVLFSEGLVTGGQWRHVMN